MPLKNSTNGRNGLLFAEGNHSEKDRLEKLKQRLLFSACVNEEVR